MKFISTITSLMTLMALGATATTASAADATSVAIQKCDIAASHPADPDKVAPGWGRKQMDLEYAEKICREALAINPDRARTNYHLGRAIYYQGRHDEATPYLEKAAKSGYRQAIFVLGYTLVIKEPGERDYCRAKDLWTQAVELEHPWSAVHLVDKQLEGSFAQCGNPIGFNRLDELMEFAKSTITIGASYGRVEAIEKRLRDAEAE